MFRPDRRTTLREDLRPSLTIVRLLPPPDPFGNTADRRLQQSRLGRIAEKEFPTLPSAPHFRQQRAARRYRHSIPQTLCGVSIEDPPATTRANRLRRWWQIHRERRHLWVSGS